MTYSLLAACVHDAASEKCFESWYQLLEGDFDSSWRLVLSQKDDEKVEAIYADVSQTMFSTAAAIANQNSGS